MANDDNARDYMAVLAVIGLSCGLCQEFGWGVAAIVVSGLILFGCVTAHRQGGGG